jgi:hypothetical protein
MMERFPTWRIWKLIHAFPSEHLSEILLRVLHAPVRVNRRTLLNNAWTWVVINVFMNFIACTAVFEVSFTSMISFYSIGALLIPFITMLIALGFSMRVAQMIARQREVGNFDLFAALPEGELSAALFIARAYRHPLEGEVRGFRWLVILTILSLGIALFSLVSGLSALAVFPAWFLSGGVERFVGYLQSLVAATAIALLVSQRRNPSEAMGWLVGGFFVLQVLFYIASGALLNAFALTVFAPFGQDNSLLIYVWVVILQPLLLIFVREFINYLLWQAVRRRLDT